MEDLRYCKTCLITDVKMYSMDISCINDAYLQLMQLPLFDKGQQYVCFECASLLQKYQEFRSKCCRAYDILASYKISNPKLAKEFLQNINRRESKLESNLSRCSITTYTEKSFTINCIGNDQFYSNEIKTEVIKSDEIILHDIEDTKFEDNWMNELDEHGSDQVDTKDVSKKRKTEAKPKRNKKKKLEETPIVASAKEDDVDKSLGGEDEPSAQTLKNTKENNKVKKKKSQMRFDLNYFKDYATVMVLTPEEAKKEMLLRKESSNYQNCPYKCDLCYRGFDGQHTYENHMKKHSMENGKYVCELCQMWFPRQIILCKHRLLCHKRKFCCKICPYVCFSLEQAKVHVRLHKGKKYPCKECGEIFSMPNSLSTHRRIKHQTKCACDLCGSTFVSQQGLHAHKAMLHRKENNDHRGPKCEDCDIHFATETAWKRHLVLSSKHEVDNGCEFCGETFLDKKSLKRHVKTHPESQRVKSSRVRQVRQVLKIKKSEPLRCAMCDEVFDQRINYKAHMTTKHPKSAAAKRIKPKKIIQYICEVCGVAFKNRCFLLYHQRRHTGERPYECFECGKGFVSPTALHCHKNTHKATRYECDMCGKAYKSKSNLGKHVKAHLGIRPYKCPVCENYFPDRCVVKLHMKYVHSKELPYPKRVRRRQNAKKSSSAQNN